MKNRSYFQRMLALSPEERRIVLEEFDKQGVLFSESEDLKVFRDRFGRKYLIEGDKIIPLAGNQLELPFNKRVHDELKEENIGVLRADKIRRLINLPPKIGYKQPSEKSVSLPPGILLGQFAELFFSKKTVTEVTIPILSDMQMEYCEALAENWPWKARWVRIRGYWSFWKVIVLFNLLKTVAEIWRKGISG